MQQRLPLQWLTQFASPTSPMPLDTLWLSSKGSWITTSDPTGRNFLSLAFWLTFCPWRSLSVKRCWRTCQYLSFLTDDVAVTSEEDLLFVDWSLFK